jgi:5-methylcytosine-specific restriction enzyme A
MCFKRGLAVPATVADHVVPHDGDWNAFLTGALQSLCEHCHNSTKRRIDLGAPPRRYSGEDGYPVEVGAGVAELDCDDDDSHAS